MKSSVKISIVVFLVLFIDQALKIWVKTHMEYGEEIQFLGVDWALIHFVENNGMAFGLQLGGNYGKLILSLFRIVAVGFLVYYIQILIKEKAKFGLLLSFGLILAGAVGNILDSAFYGLIFSESSYHGGIAQLFPPEGGYGSFLHGKVVDMLYFPLIEGNFPDWFPIWGGEHFMFFKPVFNIADAAISAGVINILLFQRSFFSGSDKKNEEAEEIAATIEANDEVQIESKVKQEGENQQQEDEVEKDENELL